LFCHSFGKNRNDKRAKLIMSTDTQHTDTRQTLAAVELKGTEKR